MSAKSGLRTAIPWSCVRALPAGGAGCCDATSNLPACHMYILRDSAVAAAPELQSRRPYIVPPVHT